MDFAQTLIEGFVNLLIAAGAVLLVGLVSLAVIRVLAHALPVAGRMAWALGAAVGLALAGLVRQAVTLLIASVQPVLVPVVCVGAEVIGLAYALPACWHAFGDDVPALLPATAISALPLAAVLLSRQTWGGLLLAGAVTLATGGLISAVPAALRAVLVMATIGGLIFHSLKSKGHSDDEQQIG